MFARPPNITSPPHARPLKTEPLKTENSPAPPTPGLRGHFRITAARDRGGRTYLSRQDVRSPWHLSKPYWNGTALTVLAINATAGMLQGDELELSVEAGPGTSLCITSPSASRAYTMRGGSAVCRQIFTAAAGAALDVFPEPLFPHARTRYRQETICRIEPGASVFLAEQIAPGRAARGEIWAWDRLDLLTEVHLNGRLILAERLENSGPELGNLAARHGFPAEAWFGTAVLTSPALETDDTWLPAIRNLHRPDSGIWAGISRLPTAPFAQGASQGVASAAQSAWIFKTTAATAPLLRQTLRHAREILSPALPLLGQDLRKSPQ